jgi:UDP-N-acetylmuramoyl-L-alanyl-D-glutamate--2,6-diaminopimelate ligase
LNITELFGFDAAPVTASSPGTSGAALLQNPEITGITADSRLVQPGFLFAALNGVSTDGRRFAGEAVARGAIAILTDDPTKLALGEAERSRVAFITDTQPHRRLALLASRFYPQRPATLAAVTGTNGKTSIAHFTREIWQAIGHEPASLGTLGWVVGAERHPGALTTPDPVALHRTLSELAGRGVDHAVIEASSHGLAQYRLDGLAFAAAAFSNLTRDHLDYHGDMESYRAAKERLFTDLLAPGGSAVINVDSPEFPRLAALMAKHGHKIITYGESSAAELRLVAREPRHDGQRVRLSLYGMLQSVDLKLVGDFQAMNVLAALGLVVATGSDVTKAAAALPALTAVPGRMQFVGAYNDAAIFVDYAHTPDALKTVLAAARPHTAGRLVVVFGAGGNRDPGKRPMMGKACAEAADILYVTDDNPRTEEPAAIRRAVLAGAPGASEIDGRRTAIYAAIAALAPGDVLVIAGKGHETGQVVGRETLPFDDVAVAAAAIADAIAARTPT